MRLCPAPRVISVLSALICSGLLLSCGGISASQGGGGTPKLTQITIAPSNPSIMKGASQQLTATGTYSDGSTQNLTSTAAWSSSAPKVATINAAGLANGLILGSTTITAVSGTVQGTTTLTVTAPVLASIAVTPANSSIAAGNTQQFTATGTYT